MFYLLESTAERHARRNNDIKHLFQHLTVNEGMSFMNAFLPAGLRIVDYRFEREHLRINIVGKIDRHHYHH